MKSGESKLSTQEEIQNSINTLAQAEALDSQNIEQSSTIASTPNPQFSIPNSQFIIPLPVQTGDSSLSSRLSLVEASLKQQNDLINSELSLQKQTILGVIESMFNIASLVPSYPISTIVVQGSPATLTTYSVAPIVQSGFDRLSASYLHLSNDATVNGSLTVKSGANLNSLSVSDNVAIGGTLNVTGDTTMGNLTVNGTLVSGSTAQFNMANASTTDLTVSSDAWIENLIAVSGTMTNGVITNGTITNASTTYLTVGSNFWGDTGLVSNAIKTPLIWNDGALTASTTGANPIVFAANSSERMRIDENGRILISTTTVPLGFGTNIATSTFVYGNQFISGGLGVGVATTTSGNLQTSGSAFIGGDLYVSGNSTVLGNSTVIGESTAGTLTINSSINSDFIPDQNVARDIGSTAKYWKNAYISTLTVNSISAASTTIGGTQSNTFTINSDNATIDNETETLIFFRGQIEPNALLTWNAATSSKRFEFNQSLYINNASASTTNPTLTIQTIADQTADALRIIDNNSNSIFSVNPFGNNTTIANASTTYLTVSGSAFLASSTMNGFNICTSDNGICSGASAGTVGQIPYYAEAGKFLTPTSTIFLSTAGNVGIGTASPGAKLDVRGSGSGAADYYTGSTLISRLYDTPTGTEAIGAQQWNLYYPTTATAYGSIVYTTPGSGTGIKIFTGGLTTNRFDLSNQGTYFQLGFSGTYTNTLNITNTGNVGIGTTGPGGKLQVAGNVIVGVHDDATSALLVNRWSSVYPNAYIGAGDIDRDVPVGMVLSVRNASGAYTESIEMQAGGNILLKSGNVGIGTTTPETKLDVVGGDISLNNAQRIKFRDSTATLRSFITMSTDNNFYFDNQSATNASYVFRPGSYQRIKMVINDSAIGFNGTYNNAITSSSDLTGADMVITNGNVGIGTTSPAYKLDVWGTASGGQIAGISANSSASISFVTQNYDSGHTTADSIIATGVGGSGGGNPYFRATVSGATDWSFGIDNADSDKFKIAKANGFSTNVFATIDGSGNVGIGTTSPSVKLQVANGSFLISSQEMLTNSGAFGMTDWVDGDSDGFANGWQSQFSGADGITTGSIVTGNGFTGNAQRAVIGAGGILHRLITTNPSVFTIGKTYKVTFRYRASFNLMLESNGGAGVGSTYMYANTSATPSTFSTLYTAPFTGNFMVLMDNANVGDWVEIDEVSVKEVGNLLVDNGGFAGIGTTSPLTILAVQGKDTTDLLNIAGTNGDSKMYITSAGNVGIGTTSPNNLLSLSSASTPALGFTTNSGLSGWTMGIDTADQNKFKIASSTAIGTNTKLTIDGNGNVGIGTTSPGYKLDVAGIVNATSLYVNGAPYIGSQWTTLNSNIYFNTGNVGIGTSTPTSKLSVVSTTGSQLTLAYNSANSVDFTVDSAGSLTVAPSITTATTTFGSGDEAMRIDSIGNIGMGTTTPTTNLTVSVAGSTANVAVTNGWLCVDNDGGCTGGTAGTVYFRASATGGSDVAENYLSASSLEPGDIVMASGGANIEKATTTSPAIIGIISTQPGALLGYDANNSDVSHPVALSGRVPAKVSLENGPIAIGDKISASSVPGIGMRAATSSITVGMALEAFDPSTSSEQVGKILVFVNLGQPNLAASKGTGNLSSMITLASDINMDGFSLINVKSIVGLNNLWSIDSEGNITAKSVNTQALTVGGAASGVTVYDRSTSAPKCIYIEGGVIKTSDGACGTTSNAGAPAEIIPAGDTTAPVVETPPVTTSTPPTVEEPPMATTTPEIIPTATTTPDTATTTP